MRNLLRSCVLAACGAWVVVPPPLWGEEPPAASWGEDAAGLLRSAFIGPEAAPTLGGKQLWTDEFVYQGWRVQRNVLTGHCRLLDNLDQRLEWGTYAQCCDRFETLRREKMVPEHGEKCVVLLHGLFGNRSHMAGMESFLKEHSRFDVVNVGYASSQANIGDHAASLAKVLAAIEPKEIHFVAHSMGNLVVRHFLHDAAQTEQRLDLRVKRIVMVAPPNQQPQLAVLLKEEAEPFRRLFGGSVRELGVEFDRVKEQLATPACEFGIIAARCALPPGGNPSLSGDDDLVVRVDETKLPGACDFTVVPGVHPRLCNTREVQDRTLKFLEQGCFETPERRQPIHPAESPRTAAREKSP